MRALARAPSRLACNECARCACVQKCKLSLVKSILIKVKHKRKYLPGYRNLGEVRGCAELRTRPGASPDCALRRLRQVSISLSDLFGEESPVVRGNSYKVRAFVWPLQRRKLRASCVKVNKWYDLLTRTSRRQRVRATGRLLVEVMRAAAVFLQCQYANSNSRGGRVALRLRLADGR